MPLKTIAAWYRLTHRQRMFTPSNRTPRGTTHRPITTPCSTQPIGRLPTDSTEAVAANPTAPAQANPIPLTKAWRSNRSTTASSGNGHQLQAA